MKIFKRKIRKFYKEIFALMRKPVMSILPGHLSFFLLLSLIPIILLMGIIAKTFSLSFDHLIEFVKLSLPASTSKLILPLFSGKALSINITFLVFSAIYLASRGTKAIINAAGAIYNVNRSSYKDVIKSIVITFLLICLFIFIIFILIIGDKLLELVNNIKGFELITKNLINIYNFSKWPISLFVIFFVVKLIYTLTPNKRISSKSVTKGSIFTTTLWIILTFVYSYYITNFTLYNSYYGSASNLIIFMLWVYLISYIFVLGMIINAIEDKNEEY